MKNVLVLAHDDEGQEGRLQVALDVTRALAGHLTCLDVAVVPMTVSDHSSAAGEAALAVVYREREAVNVARLRKRLEREDVSWDIRETVGDTGRALEEASDLADIIVVSSRGDKPDVAGVRSTAAYVAARSDRLVLAVPPDCNGLDLRGKALIAWDGSREANDALRAALPLLQMASGVTLLEVNASHNEFAAEEAASYLSRHGVHPSILRKETDGPVTEAVLARAGDSNAAYIVMGAFGQARAIESLFGGVTLGMLDKSALPLVLAH